MSFTVLQNTPTVIDLAAFARTTGWTLEDGVAKHEACNDGFIGVMETTFTPVTGKIYTVSYKISNYVSGSIRMQIGTTLGTPRTANGLYVETLVAGGADPLIRFFGIGVGWLETIDAKPNFINTDTKKRNTAVYSETSNKWSTFYSFTSDFGLSLFKDLFTFKAGKMYRHDPLLEPRNNVYGVQYDTIINMPFNINKGQPKSFESISYEGNMLLVTTTDGVVTSLGQLSGLIDQDFLIESLNDGITQLDIYDKEGVYSASFVPEGRNYVDGSLLKGSYMTVELITTDNGILNLNNVMVNSVPSKIGSR